LATKGAEPYFSFHARSFFALNTAVCSIHKLEHSPH
jgi:hypothetical protein